MWKREGVGSSRVLVLEEAGQAQTQIPWATADLVDRSALSLGAVGCRPRTLYREVVSFPFFWDMAALWRRES